MNFNIFYNTRICTIKILLVILLLVCNYSQANEFKRWVVYVPYSDISQLKLIQKKFDHLNHYPEKKLIGLEISQSELEWFNAHKFQVKIDTQKTQLLNKSLTITRNFKNNNSEGTGGIPGFSCYRTVEETTSTAESLVANYPTLATWSDIGDSWEKTQNSLQGYDINVLTITNSAISATKPPLFITAGVHAREYTNSELVTRFAEKLLTQYGIDPDITWLIDYHSIHLVLSANPDGRKMAETGLSWRKNTNNLFCPNTNDRGIDLNRNFDFQWGCCGGSSTNPCSTSFRGSTAGSEPETLAISNYMSAIFPDQRVDDLNVAAPIDSIGTYLDIHSFGEVILSSWGFTSTIPPNGDGILSLARKYAFFNNYAPQLGSLGTVDGSTKDYAYGKFGVPGYTIELGTAFFEDCSYFENSILNKNLDTLLYAAKASRQPYTIPLGPDTTIQSLNIPYVAGQNITINATADDTRYTNGAGTPEPIQNINQAEFTINTPPWSPSATPIAMDANDGVFDQTQEEINSVVDTTSLPPGKHTIFIRSEDSDNNWGAVSSIFLDIIDPVLAPTISGTVIDASSFNPIEAVQISINNYQIATNNSGDYSIQLPAGTYSMTLSVDGYQTQILDNLSVINSQNTVQDFALVPLISVFEDDIESGNLGWNIQGNWAITQEQSFSPTHSWSDSPASNYPDNADISLTSQTFDLSAIEGLVLNFRHNYDFESTFDFGRVEVSTDNGNNWAQVVAFTGSNSNQWNLHEIALPQLSNISQAKIRFRVTSDTSVTQDGWHIDDITLQAPMAITDTLFKNGFE
jgi:hypothetical protein